MNAQARAEFQRTDAELNKSSEALLAKLPDADSKEKLGQSQRAWLAFRDAETAFATDQARGGSMALQLAPRNYGGTDGTANQTAKNEA